MPHCYLPFLQLLWPRSVPFDSSHNLVKPVSPWPFHRLRLDQSICEQASVKRHLNPGSINLPFSFPQISSELLSLTTTFALKSTCLNHFLIKLTHRKQNCPGGSSFNFEQTFLSTDSGLLSQTYFALASRKATALNTTYHTKSPFNTAQPRLGQGCRRLVAIQTTMSISQMPR